MGRLGRPTWGATRSARRRSQMENRMGIERSDLDAATSLLTFSNPANGNCVESADLMALAAHLDDLSARPGLVSLIVTGAGSDFCKGRIAQKDLTTAAQLADDLNHILAVNERLGRFPGLVIAAVEGEALGFGCGFATQCDVTIVGQDAQFALPEMSHGLPPLIVLSYLTKYLPYKQAFELALTSRSISAERAVEIGMATRAVPSGTALDDARELSRFVQTLNPRAIRELRRYARRVASLHDDAFAQYGLFDIATILSEGRS